MNRLIVLALLFVLVGQVSAVTGAKCKDNVLTYYDMFNVVVKRDCSILHSGSGQVFRGICKQYDGGADCWRTEGAVTPEYRDTVRGYVYNASDVWDEPYNPTTTIVGVTTTTIPVFDVTRCPVCSVCSICENCTSYKEVALGTDSSLKSCEANYASCTSKVSKMVYMDVYTNQRKEYETKINIMSSDIAAKTKEIDRLTKNSDLYYYMALGACVVVIFIIGVWVKYEWIGDPKSKGGLMETKI
jgi:hypothetical protein